MIDPDTPTAASRLPTTSQVPPNALAKNVVVLLVANIIVPTGTETPLELGILIVFAADPSYVADTAPVNVNA